MEYIGILSVIAILLVIILFQKTETFCGDACTDKTTNADGIEALLEAVIVVIRAKTRTNSNAHLTIQTNQKFVKIPIIMDGAAVLEGVMGKRIRVTLLKLLFV